ncbi:S41 family peptidase [Pendulispora brunnea]|uniref:S41 family peptidase n=1 Tax=Pendulispora brunnea TaxID=2905690 RepID=A0ABZ2KGH6_9BACT
MGALAFAGGLVGTVFVSPLLAHATPQAENPYAATLQLGRVLVQVENNYVEPVERTKLVNGAIAGMVEQLDPHSSYLPPQEFTAFQDDTEGKFGGVGIEVDVRSDAITVLAPIEGTPAERAGIRSGDRIVGIDGEQVLSSSLDTMIKRMRGKPGTHIKFTVRREGVKEMLSFDLVREIIHVSSVTSKLLDGNIGYLRIKQFQDRTHEELLRAAAQLRTRLAESTTARSVNAKQAPAASLAGLVLDLRSNPGGLVDEAAEVADEFLSGGGIYTTRHRGQTIDDVRARGGGAFSDVPIVVLVNEWSASASELVAGALQDNKRATVVGANTFGKGSVQSIIELPGGAGLRLTTARYYTPAGRSIQAEGIHPDVLLGARSSDPNALRAVHERDLEGHLAGETRKTTTNGNTPAARMAPDGGTLEPIETRDIPSDPTKSKDFVLRTGYELLRDKLGTSKAPLPSPPSHPSSK